ncbi:sugar efflux transporter [Veronia pacifica]|nr:sugar efflux transporter [Veronia pacifica]
MGDFALGAKPIRLSMEFFRGESGTYLSVNILTAIVYFFMLPVMSLFLVQGLGIEPGYIGVYTVGTATAAIIASYMMGGLADRGVSKKKLMITALIALVCAALSFSVLTEFWQAVLTGIMLMSVGSSSITLLLTMIRSFAERSEQNTTQVMSKMRSSVSLFMVVGPSLAFLCIDYLGFRSNFTIAALFACLALFITWRYLPEDNRAVTAQSSQEKKGRLPLVIYYLGAIILLASLARMSYMSAMPLYLTEDLGLPTTLPGIFIGIGAAFEVPIMLLAGWLAQRVGKVRLLMLSFVFGQAFFISLQFANEVWQFAAIQLFNGAFFGIFVGLAVSLLQDHAPNHVGKSSAIYFSAMSAGSMLGSSVMGIVAQYYGYKNTFFVSLTTVSLALVMLSIFYFYSQKNIVFKAEYT